MKRSGARFVLVANGRTGSTLLADLLRSHPAIQCEDEVLNETRWRGMHRPLGWLARAFPMPYLGWRARRATRPVYGFKLKTGGQVYGLGRVLDGLHRRGWRLIHLHRRDALQQALSWSVAQASGRWQTTAGQPGEPHPVTLEVEGFLRDLRTCVKDRQALAGAMRHLPHLPLVYEADLESAEQWPATTARVCAWLGVAPVPLGSRHVKTWDRPYAEVVTNHAEVMAAVARSPFGGLLASPGATPGGGA